MNQILPKHEPKHKHIVQKEKCVCCSLQFLQMESELVRQQIAENEGMFQANLQSLRERNIQCEDLKGALGRLK